MIFALQSIIFAGAGAAFGAGIRTKKTIDSIKQAASEATVEGRLDQLSKAMSESARLVEQVSAELDTRAATARRMKAEAESAEALAALHKDQANAVRNLVNTELATATRSIRSDSIKIGIGSFFAGGGLTVLVTLLVHPLN